MGRVPLASPLLYLGILLVEAGVLVTVTGAMIALFYAFVERGR